jgi:hypothetical protein
MKRLDQVFCDLGHRGDDDDCANCVIQHRSLIRQVLLLLLLGQQPSLQRSCAQVLPLYRLLERLEQESLQTFALKEWQQPLLQQRGQGFLISCWNFSSPHACAVTLAQ